MRRSIAISFAATMAVVAVSCRSPTEITVVLSTDVKCADFRGVSVTVGAPGEVDAPDVATTSSTCDASGNLGSIVLTPSGDKGAAVAFRVVVGAGRDVSTCVPPYGAGCIVARRALRYIPHTPLTIDVPLREVCSGVACGPTETCVAGACVSAEIADPAACDGRGCDEAALAPPGDAGSADTGVDATLDAGSDALGHDANGPPPRDATPDTSPDAGPPAVLLVSPDDDAHMTDVKSHLDATGAFSKVDVLGAKTATPTATDLLPYFSVLVWGLDCFADQVALGDSLATYYDNGGHVVLAYSTEVSPNCDEIKGTFGTAANGYMLFTPGSATAPADTLGTIFDPTSPLVAGVRSLSALQAFGSTSTPTSGATVVAQWGRGDWLIVAGKIHGRNRVDLNMYPPSAVAENNSWTGNGAEIMRNALLYQ